MHVVVHDGAFHSDEVTAVAILRLSTPDLTYARSRRAEIIDAADVVFDVGGKYDPDAGRFDHHQIEGAGARPTGIPYASAGLSWRHFGARAIRTLEPDLDPEQVSTAYFSIDATFIANIDAVDCGVDVPGPFRFGYSNLIGGFNPGWRDDRSDDAYLAAFERATRFAEQAVGNLIRDVADGILGAKIVREIYAATPTADKAILVLESYVPWSSVVTRECPKVQFVVFPDTGGGWRVRAVRKRVDSYASRRDLPEAWAGLEWQALDAVTGVPGGIFCHRGRFIAGHATREGALALARRALAAG